ncbi:MAG: VOC family protein [Gammaproteobacteria bacterium]
MANLPFHLAILVNDLAAARTFYGDVLGCAEGRSAEGWVDFNMYGHQLVCHLDSTQADDAASRTSQVDASAVPVPHFGVVLDWSEWEALQQRLSRNQISFLVTPAIRFRGLPGEQGSFFVLDPAGNALEFKAMREPRLLFAAND